MTDIAASIANHKFNPEIAKKAFAQGYADENVGRDRSAEWMPVYRKFYVAAWTKGEKDRHPERIKARQEEEMMIIELHSALRRLMKGF